MPKSLLREYAESEIEPPRAPGLTLSDKERFFVEPALERPERFFASLRMTGSEGLRMTAGEGLRMT